MLPKCVSKVCENEERMKGMKGKKGKLRKKCLKYFKMCLKGEGSGMEM